MKDVVIFGAGLYGRQALEAYGERVVFFVDNDPGLLGKKIRGIEIKRFDELAEHGDKYHVVIASKFAPVMEKQLMDAGVTEYELFYNKEYTRFYETDELVLNPYEDNKKRGLAEGEYNEMILRGETAASINEMVRQMYSKKALFEMIEIETINRCNGTCDFCPVNAHEVQREYAYMDDELFESIIWQLADMDYSGRLSLFSNNEPLLDKNIIARHRYARNMLPNARMHLFTNGTLLTLEKFVELIDFLDELIIDNYDADLKLIPQCKEILEYCQDHPGIEKKVTIVLRNPHEILSSRGGESPNRNHVIELGEISCVLPFKEMEIRPTGEVSLCCCDALGKMTMGDLRKQSLLEVWEGEKFERVRKLIYKGRKNIPCCSKCDYLGI